MFSQHIYSSESLHRRGHILGSLLGTGAAGCAFAAEAPGGVPAVVKIISLANAAFAQRELRAIDAIKQWRHVHLLRLREFWKDEFNLYIVTDLADGNIRGWAKEKYWIQGQAVPAPTLYRYMEQIASATDFLHLHGVVHRDIKPDNILMLNDDVILGDPGLARRCDWDAPDTDTFAGTRAYMAPELWTGTPVFASDQYALAVTTVELLTGKLHRDQPPASGSIGECQRAVFRRALAIQPTDRFPCCTAFVKSLQEAFLVDESRESSALRRPA